MPLEHWLHWIFVWTAFIALMCGLLVSIGLCMILLPKLLDAPTRMLAFCYGTIWYIQLYCSSDKLQTKKAAGRLLYARISHLRKHEPEIVAALEDEMRFDWEQRVASPPQAGEKA